MSFWSRFFKKQLTSPPRWSSFIDIEQYQQFEDLVLQILKKHDFATDRALIQSGSILINHENQEKVEWFLYELAKECSQAPLEKWELLIQKSLVSRAPLLAKKLTQEERNQILQAGSSSKEKLSQNPKGQFPLFELRSQLFSTSYLKMLSLQSLVCKPLTEDLYLILVRDLADAAEFTVHRSDVAHFAKSDEELLIIGRKNGVVVDADHLTFNSLQTAFGLFEIVVNNKFYLGACMLELLERSDFAFGMLICIFSWHHWICHEISKKTTIDTIKEMKRLITHFSKEIQLAHYEHLSTNVYWFQKDLGFIKISFQEENGIHRPVLPEQLESMLIQ